MTEPIMNVFEVLDKLDFFNQRAGRELWSEKPVDVQNKDIENFSNDVAFLKDYITSQNAELLQCAKDQHDLMIEKDKLFDIAEKQKAEIEDKSNRLREILPMVADIRDGAIKAFAERLKELYTDEIITDDMHCSVAVIKANTDNLVKEMIGEQ